MAKKTETKTVNNIDDVNELVRKITQEEVSNLRRDELADEIYINWLDAKASDDYRIICKFFRSISEQWLGFTEEYKIKDIWETIEPIYTGKDILQTSERRNLYKIQERLFDKLDYETVKELESAGKTLTIRKNKQKRNVIKYQLPPEGTIISKQWNGKNLEVTIINGGFEYEGETHRSLSSLASYITGYPCSGPMFFGIKKQVKNEQ